jgi:collagenase-like PrtC family protease
MANGNAPKVGLRHRGASFKQIQLALAADCIPTSAKKTTVLSNQLIPSPML